MSYNFQDIPFIKVDGKDKQYTFHLIGLSTCALCEAAQDFLRANNCSYYYVSIDAFEQEVSNKYVAAIESKFGTILDYPTLIINSSEKLSGFHKVLWIEKLGFKDNQEREIEAAPFNHDEVWNFVRKVSFYRQWKLNPDTNFTQKLVNGLFKNKERFGYYQCPCRRSLGERKLDRDVICPCQYAEADIAEYGRCFCGLFHSYDKTPDPLVRVPERRTIT